MLDKSSNSCAQNLTHLGKVIEMIDQLDTQWQKGLSFVYIYHSILRGMRKV